MWTSRLSLCSLEKSVSTSFIGKFRGRVDLTGYLAMALAEAIARNMGFQQSGCSVSIAGCSVSTEVQMYFIAELDDLCHCYLVKKCFLFTTSTPMVATVWSKCICKDK